MSSPITPQQALTQIQQNAAQIDQLNGQISSLNKTIESLAQQGLDYTPPPPPTLIDVWEWFKPKPGKAVRPTFIQELPDRNQFGWFVKNKAGWPMDGKIATADAIYDRITENDDKSGIGWPDKGVPTAYRYHPTPLKICPRYYDSSQGRILVSDNKSLISEVHTDCTTFTTHDLGPNQCWFSYVKNVQFKGQLGVQDALLLDRFYTKTHDVNNTAGFNDEELYYFTAESGWVRWVRLSWDSTQKKFVASQDITANNGNFIPDMLLGYNLNFPVFPCIVKLD